MLAAHLVALLHAGIVLLVVVGGLLALRHPRVLLLQVCAVVAVVGVNLAGADCPLTDLERALRERAGGPVYTGGFLEHYVFTSLGVDGTSSTGQLVQRLLVIVPNGLAYTLLARRRRRSRRRRVAVRVAA